MNTIPATNSTPESIVMPAQALIEARSEIVALYREVFDLADKLGQMTNVARRQAHLICTIAEAHSAGRHAEVNEWLDQLAAELTARMAPATTH